MQAAVGNSYQFILVIHAKVGRRCYRQKVKCSFKWNLTASRKAGCRGKEEAMTKSSGQ